MITKRIKLTMRETMKYIHKVNIARITHYSLRVAVWMEKHAVYMR